MENIPSFMFDLIEHKPFEDLSEKERGEVLQHISEEEYNMLRTAALRSGSFIRNGEMLQPGNEMKDRLMLHFAQKHQTASPLKLILNKPVAFWKVAALFLLLGGATLLMAQMKKGRHQIQYITQLDTVYLEKELPATKVYDTIYLSREAEHGSSKPSKHLRAGSRHDTAGIPEQLPPDYTGINLMSMEERDRPLNNKKGSSIKDDSLINTYGFVRL